MTTALGYKGGTLQWVAETAYGDAVARTNIARINSESITKEQGQILSAGIANIFSDKDDVEKDKTIISGDVSMDLRYESFELLIEHALGTSATVEVATVATSGSTNLIKFKEDAGSVLSATVATATLIMGESGAVADTHCKAIKTALEAAGSGTYTITFSNTTKKMTIAVAGGASAFQYIETDSTGGGLIGFTEDSASAASVVSDTAVVTAFTHTNSLSDTLPLGLSLEIDMDTKSKLIEGGKIESITFAAEVGGYLTMTLGIMGEDMTYVAVTTGNTLSTSDLIPFNEIACTYGGAQSITKFEITLKNNLNADRYFLGALVTSEPLRGSERYAVTGSITIEFEDNTEFDSFVAQTAADLVITATGETLIGSTTDKITITAKNIKLLGAVPNLSDIGIIPLEIPFKAYATDTSTRELIIAIVNTLSSV